MGMGLYNESMVENGIENLGAKRGGRFIGYILGVLGIFFLVLLILFFAPRAASWYGAWKDARFEAQVEGVRKEIYDAAMADTYGGKTPQETLQMYIEAVEAGDYELASKYFVEKKREGELKSLQNGEIADIENILSLLRKVREIDVGVLGAKIDGYDFLVRFLEYPNGIWKLTDI